ncbi:outer envelope protein 64 mitochondrial [Phtheirospermum japonicum]|uniref:Outer envelope protein 64 mitochondrial n=1 Tax=Phtheirospermum japonicum TaxID=374723 RepID=A0A830BX18_9LAMI|nr:outer envelope protein 64 mitochondrial [Phtheirospermum japonicum]
MLLFDVEGYVTGFGNPDLARTHSVATSTAPVVVSVLKAGATCIVKTVMDDMAYRLSAKWILKWFRRCGWCKACRFLRRYRHWRQRQNSSIVLWNFQFSSVSWDCFDSWRYSDGAEFRPLVRHGWFVREPLILKQVGKILLLLQDDIPATLGQLIIAQNCFNLLSISSLGLKDILVASVEKLYGTASIAELEACYVLPPKGVKDFIKVKIGNMRFSYRMLFYSLFFTFLLWFVFVLTAVDTIDGETKCSSIVLGLNIHIDNKENVVICS